jgi:protein-S-isoprenylcysteine O-methyltransferase Ste14
MARLYRLGAYFGLFSIFGSMLYGFRYDPAAPASNYLFNVGLYVAWAAVHLAMTGAPFKRLAYGPRMGEPIERQVFIGVTVVTWLAVLWVHRPVPGPSFVFPGPLRFAATVGFIAAGFAFFEGFTFAVFDGFFAVPGRVMQMSHGAETPLLTEGRYAAVRHPMYQAAIWGALCSLVIHANAGQLLWCAFLGATFVGFIPIEEERLVAARGEAYQAYRRQTPWRLLRGVW